MVGLLLLRMVYCVFNSAACDRCEVKHVVGLLLLRMVYHVFYSAACGRCGRQHVWWVCVGATDGGLCFCVAVIILATGSSKVEEGDGCASFYGFAIVR